MVFIFQAENNPLLRAVFSCFHDQFFFTSQRPQFFESIVFIGLAGFVILVIIIKGVFLCLLSLLSLSLNLLISNPPHTKLS